MAVRESVPSGRLEVESVAVPVATVAVPRFVPPFQNVTVPEGAVGVAWTGETVAVNVVLLR